jgi:RNA polymerase sigma-70 factor (ECF subfamily)
LRFQNLESISASLFDLGRSWRPGGSILRFDLAAVASFVRIGPTTASETMVGSVRLVSDSPTSWSDGPTMWPDPSETRDLLDRVAGHDPLAADRLWERHRAPLRRMIDLRLDRAVGRRVDASDVVQEVLLKASGRLADYLKSPSMPFHLWLRQIAQDHVIDAHRRHRVAGARSVDREAAPLAEFADRSSLDLVAGLRDPGLTPASTALRHELERRFRDAIAELDELDREVILLRHFEQLSNVEVARALNLSEPAAGMRHLRALRKLRAILGESPSIRGLP